MIEPLKKSPVAPLPLDGADLIRWAVQQVTVEVAAKLPGHDPRDILEHTLSATENAIQKARRDGIIAPHDLSAASRHRSTHTQSAIPRRSPHRRRADPRQRVRVAWRNQLRQVVDDINSFVRLRPWPTSPKSFASLIANSLSASPWKELRPLVQQILATPPAARGALLGRDDPNGRTAAELLALALVVDDIAVHGFNGWAWAALDALRAGTLGLLPPLPRPTGAEPWYWPEAHVVRQLAARFFCACIGSDHPVRRCGFAPCLGSRHKCPAAPYFVAERGDRRYCCEHHGKKDREARATSQG